MLKIAREAEKATIEKSSRKRRRKGSISIEIENRKEDIIKNISSDSDSDCITVAQCKSN